MGWFVNKTSTAKHVIVFTMALVLAGIGPLPLPKAAAAQLTERSIRVSDATAAQNNVTYRVGFTTATTAVLGSIRIQFCSNGSLIDDPCVAPIGFDVQSAVLAGQGGVADFSMSPSSTANEIILTRPPSVVGSVVANYNFINVTNPFSGGSYFARILTYPTSNATGPYTDAGGLALVYRASFGITTEVPPHLTFCIGESITGTNCTTATEPFSDLGILGPLVTGVAQSQMLVATNAEGGYTLRVIGGSMGSGNNVLPAMAGNTSQKGVSQFGLNLRANTSPIIGEEITGPGSGVVTPTYAQQNQFRFQTGDIIAGSTQADDYRKYTVSYVVNVASTQPGGVYATTLTYIALANF